MQNKKFLSIIQKGAVCVALSGMMLLTAACSKDTPKDNNTPEPAASPTQVVTEKPEDSTEPTEEPADASEEPTEEPSEEPEDSTEPTEEPADASEEPTEEPSEEGNE